VYTSGWQEAGPAATGECADGSSAWCSLRRAPRQAQVGRPPTAGSSSGCPPSSARRWRGTLPVAARPGHQHPEPPTWATAAAPTVSRTCTTGRPWGRLAKNLLRTAQAPSPYMKPPAPDLGSSTWTPAFPTQPERARRASGATTLDEGVSALARHVIMKCFEKVEGGRLAQRRSCRLPSSTRAPGHATRRPATVLTAAPCREARTEAPRLLQGASHYGKHHPPRW